MESLGQLTASELKARGWSETMIRRFLGPPCAKARNPHCHSVRPMRLYGLHKVVAAEADPQFANARARARAAAERATAGHQARIQAAKDMAWGLPIALPDISAAALRANARDQLSLASSRQRMLPLGMDDLVAAYAVRIVMDACEPALWMLDEMFSAPGVRAARVIVRKRILSMIAAAHPWLRAECVRRFRAEAGGIERAGDLLEVA